MHLQLSVFLRKSNFFQSSRYTPGRKVVARQSSADLPWTGWCQWRRFDVNQIDLLLLPPCDLVGTWPGKPYGAECWEGPAWCPGKGYWMWDGDFPPKRAGQNPVFSVYMKLRFGFHWFLQQILQGKNHFYLLLPAAACAGMSPPQGHSRTGTTRYYHWLRPWKGLLFQVFPQSSSSQRLSLFCMMLMPALHLPGCQFPSPSQGTELPKEALQPWDLGSCRFCFWETWALL